MKKPLKNVDKKVTLEARGLAFHYKKDAPVLRDINFSLEGE